MGQDEGLKPITYFLQFEREDEKAVTRLRQKYSIAI